MKREIVMTSGKRLVLICLCANLLPLLWAGGAQADDVIRINFQEAGHPVPLRTGIVHLEDSGEAYGYRGNSLTYGWSEDRTGEALGYEPVTHSAHTQQAGKRETSPYHIQTEAGEV
jgi:hypothetical protein